MRNFYMHCTTERRNLPNFDSLSLSATTPSIVSTVMESSRRNAAGTVSTTIFERLDIDPSLDLSLESDRVKTFRKWSNPAVQPIELAKAGFLYTGRRDLVHCVFCNVRLQDWRASDDPFTVHKEKSAQCPFILGYFAALNENIHDVYANYEQPTPVKQSSSMDAALINLNIASSNKKNSHNGAMASSSSSSNGAQASSYAKNCSIPSNGCSETVRNSEFKKMGIYTSKPKFADMSTVQIRILSFKSWSSMKKQTPVDLAEAGFFFTGDNDSVQCFYCGGVLRNWLPNDDPWIEHAHWFNNCDFVRLCKGDAFMVSSASNGNKTQSHDDTTPGGDAVDINADEDENAGALSIEDLDAKIPSWRGHEDVRTAFDMGYDERIVASAIITNSFSTFETLDEMIDRIESLRPYLEKMKVTGGTATTKLPKLPSINNQNKPDVRDVKLCKICMDAEISVVFLPCAHLVCCPNCSPAFEHCPLCRKEAVARLRIFMT